MSLFLSFLAAFFWLISLLLPWRAWQINEVLEADSAVDLHTDLSDITVVIPARNEAEVMATTLAALENQGTGLKVIVIDDHSNDGTVDIVKASRLTALQLIESQALPEGWTGKLWAQQQGVNLVTTPLVLLLDADIQLCPGMIASLKHKRQSENLHFVSLMAALRFTSFWEKLLMPAFIYFFKMIYPFALANKIDSKVAAAAGGYILVETQVLQKIGSMATIKDALIDDCSLAKKVKSAGFSTWIGLTHGVLSQRPYITLAQIWEMVARTAYTQLFYSVTLLLACTFVLLLLYWLPLVGLLYFSGWAWWLSLFPLVIMMIMYSPTLKFYSFNLRWNLTLPIVVGLYLLMTWTSAIRYWRGVRSQWKGRVYQKI
jgi:hopene-associated glycosyltransferase HpnB